MVMPLGEALLYSFVPALVAYAVALGIMWPAAGPALRDVNSRGKALVMMVIPQTGVIFALVAAVLASKVATADVPTWTLLLVGAAAAVQEVAQGFIIRAGAPQLSADPTAYGKLLVQVVLPEVLAILALAVFLVNMPGTAR